MKRPAFQFFPGDWRRDTALQSCSLEARGLWIETLCLMHDGEPYGHLAVNGQAITARQLAQMVGVPVARVERLLGELERAGVFDRTDGGMIVSRRLVRDEAIRERRAAGGVKSLTHPKVPQPKTRPASSAKASDNEPIYDTAGRPSAALSQMAAETWGGAKRKP